MNKASNANDHKKILWQILGLSEKVMNYDALTKFVFIYC